MKLVTPKVMQILDKKTINECGIPGIVLMENAGRKNTSLIFQYYPDVINKKVAVISGKGNNGGDGFVIARHLINQGVRTVTFLLSTMDSIKGDARINLNILLKMNADIVEIPEIEIFKNQCQKIAESDIIVDAILGTGLTSEVRGLFREAINYVNNLEKPVVAVDIPSGLDGSSGKVLGCCIKADLTATFGFPKIGQIVYPGAGFVGKLEVVDISIPDYIVKETGVKDNLIDGEELKRALLFRDPASHKGNFGHILVLAGSPGKTGAAFLACQGAMRVGTGLVTLGIPESLNSIMEIKLTEVMTEPLPETKKHTLSLSSLEEILALAEKMGVVAMGPGVSLEKETSGLIREIIRFSSVPLVIDADGISAVSEDLDVLKNTRAKIVLTPHPGEMARLLHISSREVQENRVTISRDFAREYGVYLVLKGAGTIISSPEGEISINPTGNPGMASGGMGDVLTGIIGGLIAQGYDIIDSLKLGVYLHGHAADRIAEIRGEAGLIATDVAEELPETLNKIQKEILY